MVRRIISFVYSSFLWYNVTYHFPKENPDMALVTCPKCKKTVSNTSNKCSNCGATLSYSAFDKNAPKHAKLHMASNIVISAAFVLLMVEFMSNIKTYVGGIFFGAGFLLHGLSLMEKEKEVEHDGKKRGKILVIVSFALIAIGVGYLIFDLR